MKQLKEADLETIEELVIRGVEKEQHMHCFADRKSFWCYLIGNNGPAFRQLLQDGLFHFCSRNIYEGCSKGSERILRLMIEWNSFFAKYAVSSLSTGARWEQLTRGYCSTISEDCRSSVMSAGICNTVHCHCEAERFHSRKYANTVCISYSTG